jgi:molybdopterin converting factor small subunit
MPASPKSRVNSLEREPTQPAGVCVTIHFYSYFKDLTGCAQATETLTPGMTLGGVMNRLHTRFPKLAAMKNCTLTAVGVDYQTRDYVLKDGDEVSLFPPVQGG